MNRKQRFARFTVSAAILVLLQVASSAFASILVSEEGISPTRSAEYVRTQSRNASTDPDAVYYNPAGLSFLENGGIYLMVNSVNVYTLKSNTFGMWGSQDIGSFNGNNMNLQSNYQSVNMYLTSAMFAMPTDITVIFKQENWTVFGEVSTFRGQPGATYSWGASSFDRLLVAYNTLLASRLSQQLIDIYSDSKIERQELHMGATVGASYGFIDKLAGSLSLRYININSSTRLTQKPLSVLFTGGVNANSYQVPASIDTDVFGSGMGIILGLDYQPNDKLNIGARAEFYPPMVLTKRTNRFIANPVIAQSGQLNMFCDGVAPLILNDRLNAAGLGNIFNFVTMDYRTRKNIGNRVKATYPPSLSVGLSYRPLKELKLDTSADLTFPRFRDLDGRENDWRYVGYRVGEGIEWSVATWAAISVGYSYNDYGLRPGKLTEYDDLLTSHTVGAGCSLKPWEFLTITAAGSYTFYMPAALTRYDILTSTLLGNSFNYAYSWNQNLSRNEWSVSLGVTFSFYPVSEYRRKKAEEHYWNGMTRYLSNDIDGAIDDFSAAKLNNAYFRDVGKKIKEMKELKQVLKENSQQDKVENEEKSKKGKGVHGNENN